MTRPKETTISIRLIERQAIALAKYGYRLIDCLETEEGTDVESFKEML